MHVREVESMAGPGNAGLRGAAAPLLRVRDVECRRGDRSLFAPLSFDLDPGAVVWIRGANGRGKTTLLRTLAGLSPAAAGTIAWSGGPTGGAAGAPPPLVYLAHANALKDDLTAAESLAFLLRLAETPAGDDVVIAALDRLGVGACRQALVRTLSQGQRRRVALARLAVEHRPVPWLLDEPFEALDADGIELVAGLLADHAGRGGSIVVTSHLALPAAMPAPIVVPLHAPAATLRAA